MFSNYLKIALRNLLKHKVFSLVNILGLSVGITCTVLLSLYVQHELSYDHYHPKADRIYRVAASYALMGQAYELAVTPAPLANALLTEFSEVEEVARFRKRGAEVFRYMNQSFKEDESIYADASIFNVFKIDLIKGNTETALQSPNTIILNEKTARKYFGDENPIGKAIVVDNGDNFKVTGIFKEIPNNTHFQFDLILSITSLDESMEPYWFSNNFNTYIVLNKHANPKTVEAKFPALLEKYLGPEVEQLLGKPFSEMTDDEGHARFYLQPVTDIHLTSDLMSELGQNSDIKYVYIFSAIALFILIIAGINYMNISTAQSASRAKEVGVRKVLGSNKNQLIRQFLTESFLTVLISIIISVLLTELSMSHFNDLTNKVLSLNYFSNYFIAGLLFGIFTFVGIFSGVYPAFVISSFNPASVLSRKIIKGAKSGLLRNGLVILQFATSIIMIIATLVVLNQLNFIQNKKLGFNKDHVIILNEAYLLGDQVKSMKNSMLGYSAVESASISGFLPVPSNGNTSAVFPYGKKEKTVAVQQWQVDNDYIKTMGMEIVEGRDFSKEFGNENENIIINEAMVKQFGFKNPIGERIVHYTSHNNDSKANTVIGVVKDFHFESLRNNIAPLIMFFENNDGSIAFKVKSESLTEVIDLMKMNWKKFAPNQPFNYSFLDLRFDAMYRSEQRISRVFAVFSGLAIFLGCLGLFSLSAFSAERKTKEIGIRKVLGSSVLKIVYMLSKEFFAMIFISFLIAAPIAYYFMNKWLMDFAYRISLDIWVFIGTGLITYFIAMIAVSYNAVRAAFSNPVDSLRNE
ncbi:MAG: ABC transporter permease [Melioribacteraceae bacterium]|nr:ABC transporter permease [Melioribacteraceae bacterium]